MYLTIFIKNTTQDIFRNEKVIEKIQKKVFYTTSGYKYFAPSSNCFWVVALLDVENFNRGKKEKETCNSSCLNWFVYYCYIHTYNWSLKAEILTSVYI